MSKLETGKDSRMHRRSTRLIAGARWMVPALVLLLIAVASLLSPGPVEAKSVIWKSYDVTLTLNGDGTFHVVERQVVEFEGGPFTFAYADIPLARVDEIRDITVSEERGGQVVEYDESRSERAETFTAKKSNSVLSVNWFFPRTTDQERVFLLEYEVVGGLRVYDSNAGPRQQIWWIAIGTEVTDIAPIEAASFTIELPTAVDLASVVLDGPTGTDPARHSTDGRVFKWSLVNMSAGEFLEGRLEFPALVNASAPSWQAADDERRIRDQDRDSRSALLKLLMSAAGLLAVTAGGVGMYGIWYVKGRDPGVGAVATYLNEPPDDLPPGAAGALVDEFVNERDIVATMVDLGHRGVLNIKETRDGGLFNRRGYTLELRGSTEGLRPFESAFVSAIMGSTEPGVSVDLSDAREAFGGHAESIKRQMYDELVKRGYFPVSPATTRSRYSGFAVTTLVLGGVALAIFGRALFGISGWIILPIAALALLLGVLLIISKYMPRKTYTGAESAAKWRAFKRYLEDLDENRATEGATQLFEKYLPYAVAFGLEHSWVAKFAQAGAPAPGWYEGTGGGGGWLDPEMRRYPRRRGSWGGWVVPTGGGAGGGTGGGGVDFPNLPGPQGMSDAAGKSLGSLSGGLFDLFDLAGSAFETFGKGTHGGFSGGGRSFGGGGFGGGFGGGGGGGGRGFG